MQRHDACVFFGGLRRVLSRKHALRGQYAAALQQQWPMGHPNRVQRDEPSMHHCYRLVRLRGELGGLPGRQHADRLLVGWRLGPAIRLSRRHTGLLWRKLRVHGRHERVHLLIRRASLQ